MTSGQLPGSPIMGRIDLNPPHGGSVSVPSMAANKGPYEISSVILSNWKINEWPAGFHRSPTVTVSPFSTIHPRSVPRSLIPESFL